MKQKVVIDRKVIVSGEFVENSEETGNNWEPFKKP